MTDDAQFDKIPGVSFEREIHAPLAKIWALLTEPKLLPQWYGDDAAMGEGVGAPVRFKSGHIRGTITQWRVQMRLAYSWNVFDQGAEFSDYPESYLTLDLVERDDRVLLKLTHLPVLERFEKQNAMGWHTFLDVLQAAAQGEEIKPSADYMKANAERYGVDLANLTK